MGVHGGERENEEVEGEGVFIVEERENEKVKWEECSWWWREKMKR